jgi:hypothetical protein
MYNSAVFFAMFIVCTSLACGVQDARAADINGAWASDAAACPKIFVKKGDRVSFVGGSDVHASGFIINGGQIRGRIAVCNIKSRREQEAVVNIIAVCSTDIAIDTMQFRLRVEGSDKVVREFPGMPDVEMNYHRCPI